MVFLRLCEEDKEGTPDLVELDGQVNVCAISWDYSTFHPP